MTDQRILELSSEVKAFGVHPRVISRKARLGLKSTAVLGWKLYLRVEKSRASELVTFPPFNLNQETKLTS